MAIVSLNPFSAPFSFSSLSWILLEHVRSVFSPQPLFILFSIVFLSDLQTGYFLLICFRLADSVFCHLRSSAWPFIDENEAPWLQGRRGVVLLHLGPLCRHRDSVGKGGGKWASAAALRAPVSPPLSFLPMQEFTFSD